MSGDERITDPATIRNTIDRDDWANHYQPATHRSTMHTDDAQDLSEREADANALQGYRDMIATLTAQVRSAQDLAFLWEEKASDVDATAEARAGLGDHDALKRHAKVLRYRAGELRAALGES